MTDNDALRQARLGLGKPQSLIADIGHPANATSSAVADCTEPGSEATESDERSCAAHIPDPPVNILDRT